MKQRVSNFTIIFFVILALISVVGIFTVIKIQKIHDEKLIYAMESKVEYKAERCYLEGICKDTINLNILYENKYLEEIINPVTKEVIDPNLKIEYINDKIVIDWNSVI
jgi:hypothetical protein